MISPEELRRQSERCRAEVNAERVQLGLGPILEVDPDEKDIPRCDYCGTEYSGTKSCSRCRSVFYCSSLCQKNDWKHGGHKQSCPTMKRQCLQDAKIIVDAMLAVNSRSGNSHNNVSLDERSTVETTVGGVDAIINDTWYKLDGEGTYKVALSLGLHDGIRYMLEQDSKERLFQMYRPPNRSQQQQQPLQQRHSHSHIIVYTQQIMSCVFRGGRAEGQNNANSAFNHVDGQRIKMYVLSHPDAYQGSRKVSE